MATALYGKGREGFGQGVFVWTTDDIRVGLIDTGSYTVAITTDDNLDDIAGGAQIALSAASIANKTNTLGVMDGDDITLSSVSGAQFEAIVIYKHNASQASARLIAYIDNYTGLPCTPNGGNITVSFPNDSNKIFKL